MSTDLSSCHFQTFQFVGGSNLALDLLNDFEVHPFGILYSLTRQVTLRIHLECLHTVEL